MPPLLGRLSPRRRLFVAGLAGLVAVIVVAVVVGVLVSGGGGGPAVPVAGTPAQDRPGPVLLVPGYGGSRGSLSVLARRIRAAGRKATVLHLPGNGTGSLIADAGVLNAAVNQALRGGVGFDLLRPGADGDRRGTPSRATPGTSTRSAGSRRSPAVARMTAATWW